MTKRSRLPFPLRATDPAPPAVTGPRELSITKEQAGLLAMLEREIAPIRARQQLVLTTIVAGHGINDGQFVGMGGTPDAPTIRVVVP